MDEEPKAEPTEDKAEPEPEPEPELKPADAKPVAEPPPDKLKEWTAAVALMLALALVFWMTVRYLRAMTAP